MNNFLSGPLDNLARASMWALAAAIGISFVPSEWLYLTVILGVFAGRLIAGWMWERIGV